MSTASYLKQVKEFRLATGLPVNSSRKVLRASAACTTEEFSEIADAMGDSIVTLAGMALQSTDDHVNDVCMERIEFIRQTACDLGVNIDVVMNKIHSANMSKLCKDDSELNDTLKFYNEIGVKCTYKYVDDLIAVYSSEDQNDIEGKFYPKGKLLKNVNWHSPDYSDIEEWLNDKELVKVLTEDLE